LNNNLNLFLYNLLTFEPSYNHDDCKLCEATGGAVSVSTMSSL